MNELMSGNKTYETVIPNINNITHGADFGPAVKHANGNKALLKPRCFDFFLPCSCSAPLTQPLFSMSGTSGSVEQMYETKTLAATFDLPLH